MVATESDRQVLKCCATNPPMALQEGLELGPVEILRLAQHNSTIGRPFARPHARPDRFEPSAGRVAAGALFGCTRSVSGSTCSPSKPAATRLNLQEDPPVQPTTRGNSKPDTPALCRGRGTRPQRPMGQPAKVAALQRPTRLRPGTPVDRYYIERFLSEHAERIRGNVLEVKDASYTRRFGPRCAHSS